MGSKGGQTTKQRLPKEFRAAYTESLGMARNAINQPYTPYSGQLVAGMTPMQQKGMSAISNAQGVSRPYYDEATKYTQQAAQGITPELYQRFYSPYVKDVADTTFANLMESNAQQTSGLKGGAIQSGAFGGDRGGIAQAEMARQQNLANAQAMSNIYNQGYGQAMTLAGNRVSNLGSMGQQMAGLGTGLQTSELQGAQAMLTGGAQEQATEQAKLQSAYDQWMQQQSYPYQQAQFFTNIAQGLGSTAGGNTTTPGPSAASQIIGGIGAVGSLVPSDERVKENIEPVGQLNDGQTIYRYNFKGDPKTQIGLIAQEVEKRNPDAVGERNGIKMVDYKNATEDAANSMGGVVSPGMDRQGLAGGGVPYFPYMTANSFVPEGKMGGGSGNFPKAYEAPGLSEQWKDIKPLTEDQASGLGSIIDKAKLAFSKPNASGVGMLEDMPDAAGSPTFESNASPTFTTAPNNPYAFKLASGGVAGGRNHYADGGLEYGMTAEDDPMSMNRAIEEANPTPLSEEPSSGLAGPSKLLMKESGNNFNARNAQGYVGRGQFGEERLADARRAGVLPEGMDAEAFRNNPDAQKSVENWHFNDISNFIDKNGLNAAVGRLIDGVPITREGMINIAHLGGKAGLAEFVRTNGGYDPADANGTHLSDYLAMGAKSGVAGGSNIVPASAEDDVGPSGVAPASNSDAGLAGPDMAGTGEPQPKSEFSLKKLFASDTNPSLIESIIGRRLSPEARSAVLNASFALMAGRSPYFGVNLGEAGKVGTETYYNALAQKRTTEKMKADIGLAQQGRNTDQYGAETGRLNIARQLYASMLPQIKFWQMRNPGQPLPPEYARVVNEAYPSAGMPNAQPAPAGATAPAMGAAPALGSAPAMGGAQPQTGGLPAPTGEEGVSPNEAGATTETTATLPSVSPEQATIFSQLPPEQNPMTFIQMAQGAATSDDYFKAVDAATKLMEDYKANGIMLPSGKVVPLPGSYENQAQKKRVELGAEQAGKSVNQIYTDLVASPQQNYAQTYNSLQQASNVLQNFESGSLATVKGQIAGLMQSLGLPVDEASLESAANVEKLQKIFIGGLLNSGLREKFGQVAVGELNLAMKSTGNADTQPAANRSIVGTMKGVLDWQKERAAGIADFIQQNGGLTNVDPIALQKYSSTWDEQLPDFVESGIANTPVKGEINFSDPKSREKTKAGRKYILPDGSVATYNGETFETEE